MTFSFLITAVTLWLSYIQASSALTLPSSVASPDTGLTAGTPGVECFPAKILDSQLADTKSCLQAVLQLPDFSDPGLFHNGNPVNAYKLPIIRKYGPCMTTVSIRNGRTERTTWDHISAVATSIAAICSIGQFPFGQTGGAVYVGANRNVRITLEKFTGSALTDENGLNVTATA